MTTIWFASVTTKSETTNIFHHDSHKLEVPILKRKPSILLLLVVLLSFASAAFSQAIPAPLTNLPEADVLIYISPQRTISDFLPKVMPAKEIAEMQTAFADMKKSVGVDPSTIEYVVIALRFHRPAGDLSFVPPDVMAVVGGDFSSESLLTMAQLALQDKLVTEKHGSKTISSMVVDPIAKQAEKTPLLKPFVNVGAVALTPNSLAIGNLGYIKAAADAAETGTGRIKPQTIQSLMRDPNVFMAATGAPFLAFARSFGLLGTETASREGRFDTDFGNFYAAAVISGANYSMRGAMHADNPDTAKIITNLLSSLMNMDEFKQGFREATAAGPTPIPDKAVQAMLQSFKMTAKESEVVFEADVPIQVFADMIREQMKPKKDEAATSTAPKKPATRRPTSRTKRRN